MSRLEDLRSKCLSCRRCSIGGVSVDGHTSNVFSNMNDAVRIMVVGQNPGRMEVEQGEPFVGPSGKFFDDAVESVLGMSRSDFYICNVIRCYTPSNRAPRVREMENCRHFLDAEVELIKPIVMLALGSNAFKQLTGMSGITKHHGKKIFSLRYSVPVVPLFHPSPYNTNNPQRCKMFYKDLELVKQILQEAELG